MHLIPALNLAETPYIALVGAGGKTSLMFRLASELSTVGKTVLATTTTQIFHPEKLKTRYDRCIIGPPKTLCQCPLKPGNIVVAGRALDQSGKKIKGYSVKSVDEIFRQQHFDAVLVEADGSKGRPIKAPAGHEPVIPHKITTVIGLIGMDCLNTPLREPFAHRPELIGRLAQTRQKAMINAETILKVVISPQGLYKNAPPCSQKILVLNKADSESRLRQAIRISKQCLREVFWLDRVLVTRLNHIKPVEEIIGPQDEIVSIQ